MSEEPLQVIEEYVDYYLTKDGLYIRMYGYSGAPSLLPKYATDYVVHKEAVRQVFLDGIGSFLFEHKKATYPPLPFRLGSYKFTRVKKANEFVEELGKFHFGEINFHRNDSRSKVVEHCREANVHFEYKIHWDKDESIFRNLENITALRRRFKKKITAKGGKGQDEQKRQRKKRLGKGMKMLGG